MASTRPRRPVGRKAVIDPSSPQVSTNHLPLSLKAELVAEAAMRGESLSLYVANILGGTTPATRADLCAISTNAAA